MLNYREVIKAAKDREQRDRQANEQSRQKSAQVATEHRQHLQTLVEELRAGQRLYTVHSGQPVPLHLVDSMQREGLYPVTFGARQLALVLKAGDPIDGTTAANSDLAKQLGVLESALIGSLAELEYVGLVQITAGENGQRRIVPKAALYV